MGLIREVPPQSPLDAPFDLFLPEVKLMNGICGGVNEF